MTELFSSQQDCDRQTKGIKAGNDSALTGHSTCKGHSWQRLWMMIISHHVSPLIHVVMLPSSRKLQVWQKKWVKMNFLNPALIISPPARPPPSFSLSLSLFITISESGQRYWRLSKVGVGDLTADVEMKGLVEYWCDRQTLRDVQRNKITFGNTPPAIWIRML